MFSPDREFWIAKREPMKLNTLMLEYQISMLISGDDFALNMGKATHLILLMFPNQTIEEERPIKITIPLQNIFSTIRVSITR